MRLKIMRKEPKRMAIKTRMRINMRTRRLRLKRMRKDLKRKLKVSVAV